MDAEAIAAPRPPSPWISIWFSPRRTIRRIVDAEVPPSFWPVVMLYLLGEAVAALKFDAAGAVDWNGSSMPLGISVVGVGLRVQVAPGFLALIGRWFGGEAKAGEIQQAFAWGFIPAAVAGLILALTVLIYGDIERVSTIPVLILGLIALVVYLWSYVTQVITLAEVQRFTILRAIASMVILVAPALFLLYLLTRNQFA